MTTVVPKTSKTYGGYGLYTAPKTTYIKPATKGGYVTKAKIITPVTPKKNTGYITYAAPHKATKTYGTTAYVTSPKPSLSTSKYGTYVFPSRRRTIGTPVAISSPLGRGSSTYYYK